ncbi:hypothetical protein ID866_3887 [Astraeus odoratus]|nr:hypothetical protein ID866_3887 [Astraeus odoratus]
MVRLVALLRRPRSPSKYKTLPPLGLHQSAPDRSRCFRRSVREGDRRAFVFDRGRHYDDITQEDEDYAPDEHGDNFAFEDGATTDNDDSWDDDATLLALLDE